MKKTISINISGVVFNIEEDAYDKLHGYLESIKKYFSNYEGSIEIVADIENRIAEKFFAKLKTENKQALGMDDVNELIAAMGTVQDFEAIEEVEDLKTVNSHQSLVDSTTTTNNAQTSMHPPIAKKLYRDTKRKILGGVCGGLAHYFAIDIVWIRLAFLLLFFLPAPIHEAFAGVTGLVLLGYLAYWIAFPANANLEDDVKIKKFYRSVDEKVIAGVAAGLAAYFGLDKGLVRFLFVIAFMFFGIGFMAYLLLWIAAPKAESLTQKMEMKGEPVTLSNIEENVKQSLNIAPNQAESGVAKLLLLPFRLISAVVEFLGKIFKNIFPIIRVFIGILLMIIGGSGLIGATTTTGIFAGFLAENEHIGINFGNFPAGILAHDVQPEMLIFGFLAIAIPAFCLLILGLSLILGRMVLTQNWWLGLLGAWLIGVIGTGIAVGDVTKNFAKPASIEKAQTLTFDEKKILVLDLKEIDSDNWRKNIDFDLEGTEDKQLKLHRILMSKGRTREEAEKFAAQISYQVNQQDSVLTFDERFTLPEKAPFRNQEAKLKLYIPYDKVFNITADFYRNLANDDFDNDEFEDIDWDNTEEVKKFRFVMKRGEGLKCLNCPEKKITFEDDDNNTDLDEMFSTNFNDFSQNFTEKPNIGKFSGLVIGGNFAVEIEKGNTNKVEVADLNEDLKIKVIDGVLQINADDNDNQHKIRITMPELSNLKASGSTIIKAKGFEGNDLKADLSGASALKLDAVLNQILLDISGDARAYCWGKTKDLKAKVSGNGTLNAYHLETENAQIESSGNGLSYLVISQNLKANATGNSKVRYKNSGDKKRKDFMLSGDVLGNESARKYDE